MQPTKCGLFLLFGYGNEVGQVYKSPRYGETKVGDGGLCLILNNKRLIINVKTLIT